MSVQVYIADHTPEGGILRCLLSPDGKLELLEKYSMDRPAYMCADGDSLYILLREPFMMQSGIVRFDIAPDGRLSRASDVQPVHGAVAAHILAVDGRVYCANYLSGSTILMPDRLIAHNGSGPHPQRQRCSHPHCVTASPDGKYICITDLGTDSIYICTPQLEIISRFSMPPGSGPRHLVFSQDGLYAYCSNELDCSVSVLKYTGGAFEYLGTYPVIPGTADPEDSACAIGLSSGGRRLLVSTRSYGSIAVFRIRGGELDFDGEYRLPGAWIRDFGLYGDFILCGDEQRGRVLVYSEKAGYDAAPLDVLPVAKPWCILVREIPGL